MARLDVRAIRREQVLDAAERLMAERGWQAVTFANICRAADVSHGVLTYHFADKEDLLFALFERSLGRMRQEAPLLTPGVPLTERIAAMVGGIGDTPPREFHLLAAHFVSLVDDRPDLAARLHGRIAELIAGLAAGLAAGGPAAGGLAAGGLAAGGLGHEGAAAGFGRGAAAAGGLRPDPDEAASMLLCVMIGLGLVRAAFGVAPTPAAVADMLGRYLLADGPADRPVDRPADPPAR